ncbi:MAG: hypothetical protein WC584_03865 [Candidatus Pacearchaeota archaeon]
MGKEDEYNSELQRQKRVDELREKRLSYKFGKEKSTTNPYWMKKELKRIGNLRYREFARLAFARKILDENLKDINPHYYEEQLDGIKKAAKIYEQESKGNKPYIRKKLLEIADQLSENNSLYTEDYLKWVEKYLKRNSPHKNKPSLLTRLENWLERKTRKKDMGKILNEMEEIAQNGLSYNPYNPTNYENAVEEKRQNSLEKTLQLIGSIIFIGAGLFFFSSRITGNAIGSFNNSGNIIGIIFTLIGIVLIYYFLKRN